ncbi:MAG: hypothetical protein Q9M23_01200 [Mariprofundaceae bacterium]|nr:hypothetical protein [Mariprofundaceae bacterium]
MLHLKSSDKQLCSLWCSLRLRILLPILLAPILAFGLSSCGGKGLSHIKAQAMSAVSSYKSARYYYESGDIMLARRAALRTDEKRPDYALAQQLLKDKIEPARLKLMRHYRREAIRAEKRGRLYLAKEFYIKTAAVWVGDDKMRKEVERIDLILRQKRLNHLSEVRRKEDAQLLANINRYNPPRGLDPEDPTYIRELDRAQDMVLTRGRNAWNAAKRELHEGHPEVAYIETESYQRLRPGSRRGELLMQDVREAMPKGLRAPNATRSARAARKTQSTRPESITAEHIQALINQGEWIEAHDKVIIYRRNGGDDADALMQSLDKTMKKMAEAAFMEGQQAFQSEQLDKAVAAWSKAAHLQPDNQDYTDSLRRATELQERFRILQGR